MTSQGELHLGATDFTTQGIISQQRQSKQTLQPVILASWLHYLTFVIFILKRTQRNSKTLEALAVMQQIQASAFNLPCFLFKTSKGYIFKWKSLSTGYIVANKEKSLLLFSKNLAQLVDIFFLLRLILSHEIHVWWFEKTDFYRICLRATSVLSRTYLKLHNFFLFFLKCALWFWHLKFSSVR